MTLTILDPCTGNRVTIEVPAKPQPRRSRRWVLREMDRTDPDRKPGPERG